MLKAIALLCVCGLALAVAGCDDKKDDKKPPSIQKTDAPKVDAPKVDVPKVDVPKVDVPKVDVPKVDVPKVDVPKVDAPKVDVPKVDVPKVDVPKVDAPKVDQAVATKDAQSLMDKIQQYIKDKKWDDAEAALKKLEGMKASLPGDWGGKIEALRAALTTAKSAGDVPKLPGLPK